MLKTDNYFRNNLIIVGAIVALILLIDQAIKVYIKTHFMPGESMPVFGNWFVLEYIENQGMAFGTTFGSAIWHKLALSIFRIVAIFGIGYYWINQARNGARRSLLIGIGLILAGATGNLIDSMLYDFVFPYDPCMPFNHLEGSGVVSDCGIFGAIETRHTGFLLGNVVDMFKFQAMWPDWMPLLGGKEVFPAIWNLADASISVGVVYVILRQKTFLPSKKKNTDQGESVTEET